MVVDELDLRAADPPVPDVTARRAIEVLAVGLAWALPGAMLGLLVAALATPGPDRTLWLAASGTLLGAVLGVCLESAAPVEPVH